MNLIIASFLTLGVIGLLSAVILYLVAQKFKVEEDPRIEMVEEVLPGANCGGCGYPGCHGFAEACTKASDLESLLCPVGGSETMKKIGNILGMAVTENEPKVAVIRCNGTCAARPRSNHYDGAKNCRIAHNLYGGESDCSYGCVGFGDCVAACKFGALTINPETLLPVVDEDKCTACGACVKACPKNIIELRKKGIKNRRVWVGCINKDKGAIAKKACSNACIGCGKCEKICNFDAIKIENNLAYIDFNKCRLCRKCVDVCPTGAINEVNFPPKPQPTVKASEEKPEVTITSTTENIQQVIYEKQDQISDVPQNETIQITIEKEESNIYIEKNDIAQPKAELENADTKDVISDKTNTEESSEVKEITKEKSKPRHIDGTMQSFDF